MYQQTHSCIRFLVKNEHIKHGLHHTIAIQFKCHRQCTRAILFCDGLISWVRATLCCMAVVLPRTVDCTPHRRCRLLVNSAIRQAVNAPKIPTGTRAQKYQQALVPRNTNRHSCYFLSTTRCQLRSSCGIGLLPQQTHEMVKQIFDVKASIYINTL